MKYIILLSVLGWIYCVPVDDNVVQLVKRAQETIMYGNQQNEPMNKVKKSGIDLATDTDIGGTVKAFPPVDITEQKTKDKDTVSPTAYKIDTANNHNENGPEKGKNENTNEGKALPVVANQETSSDVNGVDSNNDVASLGNDAEDKSKESEDYFKAGPAFTDEDEAIRAYLQMLESAKEYYNPYQGKLYDNYPPYPGYRRLRRSYMLPKARTIKEGHRTKRDLLAPEEERALLEYLEPYEGYEVYDPYSAPQNEMNLELLRQYLDLANPSDYTNENIIYPEERYYSNQEAEPLTYRGEPGYFVPTKRQAGLSFVPGIKRDQYFFPAFEEPRTHLAAFTGKRNYDDYAANYERLMQLARDLNLRGEGYYDPYENSEYGYRK
ncbi:hypothetical protein CHS0354_032285 [Potamilus streckersoni]|uniref:Uncharacterized protein n=1 Tax=Potamilus streckersoni TaxID=2493646 RepID=A0AAE0RPT6_9BIVA|nr:hypothetical protein CHS0354_032285 [Potamilus streckersoni]